MTYLVPGRHPLDMAVSLYHQGGNLNRERIRELTGQPDSGPIVDHRPPLHEWLLSWIEQDVEPKDSLDSLPGVLWHLTDAWNRRPVQHVVLVHYDDLVRNLEGRWGALPVYSTSPYRTTFGQNSSRQRGSLRCGRERLRLLPTLQAF